MKIRPVGAEFFFSKRRTDKTKLVVAFHIFTNAPKILPRPDIFFWGKKLQRRDT